MNDKKYISNLKFYIENIKIELDYKLFKKGTKGDYYTKKMILKIFKDGCLDKDPRPHYEDIYKNANYDSDKRVIITNDLNKIALDDNQDVVYNDKDKIIVHTPAHTISVNSPFLFKYDLSKGESPMITLRPIAVRSSIAELLWIYQKQNTDLVDFDSILGKKSWDDSKGLDQNKISNWWKDWALLDTDGKFLLNGDSHPYIGSTYGEIINNHNMVDDLLESIKSNPDGRRNIISMWQYDDFKKPHGLKPCAYETVWNVRHGKDGVDYLDMQLNQRSSDFATAGCINQYQYMVLLILFARHLGLEPGVFTWAPVNVQIYDRHMDQAKEMLRRKPINCSPKTVIENESTDFYDVKLDDIKLEGVPKQKIKEKNSQLKFPLGI